MKANYDVIIIGGGPAAYTAAIYTSRASLSTLLVTGDVPGGQLLLTSEVENFPGFREGIMGPELMDHMLAQAKRFGTVVEQSFVTAIEPRTGEHTVKLAEGAPLKQVTAKSVIVATGASAQWLGLDNETRLMGKGISACATCDGYFFKDKKVVVVGGGDSAMEEALTLTNFASEVIVIHRRDSLRASQIMQDRAKRNPKVRFIWNAAVTDVFGEKFVDGVEVHNLVQDTKQRLDCNGLFVAIGHLPATSFVANLLKLDAKGYIQTKDIVFTNIEGIFAAGDVADPHYRQAITAAGDGCRAALEAEHYIQGLPTSGSEVHTVALAGEKLNKSK